MATMEKIDPLDELLAANIEPGPEQAPPLIETLQRIEATRTRRRRFTTGRPARTRPGRRVALAGASVFIAIAASLVVVSGSAQHGATVPLGVLQAAAATAKADPPSARFAGYTAATTVQITASPEIAGSTERSWKIVRPLSDTEFEGQLVSLTPAPSPELEKRLREANDGKGGGAITVPDGTVTTEREGDQVRRTSTWRRPYGTLFSGALAPGEHPALVPTDPQQAREAVASWATGEPPAGEEASVANLLRDSVGNGDRTQLALSYARMVLTAPRVAPEVRAAVYEALEKVPGVRIDPHATDGLGRPAAALITETEHGPSPTRSELLIDPSTARVLAERSVFTVRPGANAHRPAGQGPYGEGSQETTYTYADAR
jgi:hypothetical protein